MEAAQSPLRGLVPGGNRQHSGTDGEFEGGPAQDQSGVLMPAIAHVDQNRRVKESTATVMFTPA
jgi:hypothetical protein